MNTLAKFGRLLVPNNRYIELNTKRENNYLIVHNEMAIT